MRRLLPIAAALLFSVAVAPAGADSSAPASAATAGGTTAYEAPTGSATAGGTAPGARGIGPTPTATSGGNPYGRPFRIPPLVRRFAAGPGALLAGRAATLRFRIDSPVARRVHVVIVARRAGRRGVAARLDLGGRRTGRALTYRWAGAARLAPAGYVLELTVVDSRGRALARAARARLTVRARPRPQPAPAPVAPPSSGAFPVAGPHSYGDGFGVDRGDHIHMGQDILAAEGTPVVSPRPGTVQAVGYQASGAGNYIVIWDAGRDRSYVFMHLESASIVVGEGQSVAPGQRIGRVGTTGHSTGPHLHFEDWVGAWYAGGHAIDPLPDLRSWDR